MHSLSCLCLAFLYSTALTVHSQSWLQSDSTESRVIHSSFSVLHAPSHHVLHDKRAHIVLHFILPEHPDSYEASMPGRLFFADHHWSKTEQLCMRLSHMSLTTSQKTPRFTIQHTAVEICQAIADSQKLLKILTIGNPTLVARQLLNQEYLTTWAYENHLEVWPCVPIQNFTILPMKSCNSKIPIRFQVHITSATEYLDTKMRIVSSICAPRSCNL